MSTTDTTTPTSTSSLAITGPASFFNRFSVLAKDVESDAQKVIAKMHGLILKAEGSEEIREYVNSLETYTRSLFTIHQTATTETNVAAK